LTHKFTTVQTTMPFDVSWSAPEGNGLVSRSSPARDFSANREVGDS
jgi:hypothetical protein